MSEYQIQLVSLDGIMTPKFKCPKCGTWGYLDDDQFHGRVSIECVQEGCDFHETFDLSQVIARQIPISIDNAVFTYDPDFGTIDLHAEGDRSRACRISLALLNLMEGREFEALLNALLDQIRGKLPLDKLKCTRLPDGEIKITA